MAQSKLELAVGTGKWDAGLKKAQQALNSFTQAQGGLQQALDKDNGKMQSFVQMMGKMDSTASTAKGQMNDYKRVLEQLTADYNKMSEAQRKSIGTDYLQTIDALKQKFQAAKQQVDEFNRSLGNASEIKLPEGGSGLFGGGKLDGMLQVFGGNLMTKAAGFAASFASEIGSCVQQGIELARQGEGIRNAFERLGRGDILDGLREATHGTVTDLELMKAAVKFNDFKLPVEELGTMLAFAQQKAKDTGQSVDYMVDSIVTGLGRKSLMILDNLGLSAAEIKEKMKQTGDMTKAVGAIIREQMEKAGDYVETAADRATKADVELKNAMEELGRTFQPLSDAGTSMWTALETGALKFLSSVGSVIAQLTEAGRIAKQYSNMGGSDRVGSQIAAYNNSANKEGYRKAVIASYESQINQRNSVLAGLDAWRKGNRSAANGAAFDRMEQFGVGRGDDSALRAQVGALRKQLDEFKRGTIAADNATNAPTPTIIDPKKTKAELDELQKVQAKISDLTKEAYTADESRLEEIRKEIAGYQEQEKKLISIKELVTGTAKGPDLDKLFPDMSAQNYNTGYAGSMKAKMDAARADMAMGPLNLDSVNSYISSIKSALQDADLGTPLYESLTKKLKDATTMSAVLQQAMTSGVAGVDLTSVADEMKKKMLGGDINEDAWQEFLDKLNENIEDADLKLVFDVDSKSIETVAKQQQKEAQNTAKAWNAAASAVSSVGAAMQQIEDPGVKAMGTVIQSIASIALGFAQASVQASTLGPWGWLAFLGAGAAAMATTISTVHSLTGFANGGIYDGPSGFVPGNKYSGDNVLANGGTVGLNSGELILNRAQQGVLAASLDGGSFDNLQLETRIDGRDLLIVMNNDGTVRGHGTLVRTRTNRS